MNILVTGPNGFLAKNVIKKLKKANHNILEVSYKDSLASYKDQIVKFQPDVTIHFAWFGGNNYNDATSPNQFYKNVPQSIELLGYLRECNKHQTFIGLGTACEYGEFTSPVDELDKEDPFDLYGLSKLTFKNYSQVFCKVENLNWIWIRPFYVYGPGDVPTRLVPKVINALLDNKDVIFDECRSIVDYLYIDDFVNAIAAIVDKHTEVYGVYNICSNKQYKVRDIISEIKEIIPHTGQVVFDPLLNKKRQNYTCGSNAKLKRTIKWNPKVSIRVGLIKTIKNIQNERKQ